MTETETEFEQQEQTYREQIEQQARDAWADEIEPAERANFIDEAEDEWDNLIEPDRQEQYVTRSLEAWDTWADERRAKFLAKHADPEPKAKIRSAKVEGIRAWGAAWAEANR